MNVRVVRIGEGDKFTLSMPMRKVITEQIGLDGTVFLFWQAYIPNIVAEQYTLPVIVSVRSRIQKRINIVGAWFHPLVSLLNPLFPSSLSSRGNWTLR